MEALGHFGIGIFAPPIYAQPAPPNTTKKPPRLNAVSGGANTVPDNFSASRWANRLLADFHFLPNTNTDPADHNHYHSSSAAATTTLLTPPYPPIPTAPERHVSMPIDFYRVLGAEAHFLGDGIRRCYEARVTKPPQYGYSQDALISRRQILQAACETLANSSSRREYNLGLAEDEFDTILTQVPWESVILSFLLPHSSTFLSCLRYCLES